ncbi:MAG: glutamate-1-semialdehyde 2,1-aminomutase [Nitriliruptoraceae bacterium]
MSQAPHHVNTAASTELFTRAQQVIPGGVNSPVRAFSSVGGVPRFIERGIGARLIDVDGNEYLDLVNSWGPLLFGHLSEPVIAAARDALAAGSSFGAPTRREVELAEAIIDAVASIEMVRLVNSGTEASMTAIRLARGATGRSKIIKFAGHYHGHVDALLVAAGSGVATLGIPGSPGVSHGAASDTIVVEWNDVDALDRAVDAAGDDLAAIICEPVAANMNLVPPVDGFLEQLRAHATRTGAVLIFDEVITGFRMGRGGAQEVHGVSPDLTVLGKVVGGGFPLAAFGGRRDLMEQLAPVGPVYQAGTLSGNPVAVAAGLAQLALLNDDVYTELARLTARLADGLNGAFASHRIDAMCVRHGTLAGIVFGASAPENYQDVAAADHAAYSRFFHAMLASGVYLAPSSYEVVFTSVALSDEDIDAIVAAAGDACRAL